MAEITPQALYEEFANDPTALGYAIGNGVSFNDKQAQINLVRDTIIVQMISVDAEVVNPGQIKRTLAVQAIRDAIDTDEYELNCIPSSNTDNELEKKAAIRQKIATFWSGSDGQSQFSFTDGAIAQILDTFPNATWPSTRANILGLRDQEGSRATQLFGSPDAPVSRADMYAAEDYATANSLPSLVE